ncbi:MAG TPA: carboxypeptidase-like regulatory domain-containing protein [Pyrinomonadaceae bacterium]|nr:carboxypeptidase-like regulatory domain-containing protein [Pyrinomonadaceae bacterium]
MIRPTTSGRCAAALLCALALALFCLQASAQTGTSSVRGTVADAQGHVVPGATVTLVDPDKNTTRTQTTTEDGHFAFDLIPPGNYRLETTATGFKKSVITDVQALVASPTDLNVTLEVGNVSESVTVSTSSAEVLINTQDATVGNNFVTQQITQLPLEARNVNSLLTLQPAATREGYVAGAHADQANVTLDGIDINEAQTSQLGGATNGGAGSNALIDSTSSPERNTVIRLNAEAIQEFRVTTSTPNASQGRSSGAQVEIISKPGENQFHGSLFEAHRNTIFTANDFFNNSAGVARPKLIRNTYGGSISGPVKQNKLFFFYSYEGRRDASQQSIIETVPLPSLGRGEIRYRNASGGITTVTAADLATIFPDLGGVNPAAVSALAAAAAKYPANDFTVGDGLNTAGFRFNASTPLRYSQHWANFDWNVTGKQVLTFRAIEQDDLTGGASAFPDTPTEDVWSHPMALAVQHTWTLNNRVVNSFRYGLTREAFTQAGDSASNAVYFRFVFSPFNYDRTVSRVTPVHNFTDDVSWVKGSHSLQFGANIRIVNNRRVSFENAYDTAITNPSFYLDSGTPLSDAVDSFSPIGPGFTSAVQNAASALLGRFTQYSARFTFDRNGQLQPSGTPTKRDFATQSYDGYIQDSWKVKQNLTITYGLRYSLSRPVYETNGFEAKPNIPLSEYFAQRVAAAAQGKNFDAPLTVDLSGPANGRSPLYRWDKNNFQPRIAVAWSPNYRKGWLGKLFGADGVSSLRGGFAMLNDYYGEQLAVDFDQSNTLGFLSNTTTAAGTFDTESSPGPLFTGFNQNVRTLPFITIPGTLTFPQQQPQDQARRIETSIDEDLVAPTHYVWSLTYERKLPKGLVIQMSYLGRAGRNLLVTRDVMTPNDLADPKSGMDWYTAAGMLEDIRRNLAFQGITNRSSNAVIQAAIRNVPAIPYFENLFSNIPLGTFARDLLGSSRAGFATNYTQAVFGDALRFNGNDWTTTQSDIDNAAADFGVPNFFYNSQYGALAAFSSVGNLNYNAGTVTVRERLGDKLLLDFNYTLSHSLDDASGLQTGGGYGTALVLNPLRQRDNYASSDYDVRHSINMNSIWQLPFGRGQWLFNDSNKWVNGILGGWQLSTIFRWNSGLPIYSPYDDARWATNWEVQSSGVRVAPVESCPSSDPTPKLFGCGTTAAYRSWRNAKPGETGDRNVIRLPGYIDLDAGLAKSFTMPWSEKHKLQIRWETFNVTNTQRFGAIDSSRTGFGLVLNPQIATPPTNWSNFTAIQGTPRVMQFGFRYSF